MSNIPFYVGFDQAHKERGKISSSLSNLAAILNENGYQCIPYAEFPITTDNIYSYDICVFACPDNSRISRNEVEAIKNWVKNGGGLLLLSHAGGDRGRRSNLSELAEEFGIMFENNQVLDNNSNLGVENLPTITNFGFPHPITENISELCFRAGCSRTVTSATVTPVVSSGPEAEPCESPLILAGEIGEGRVVGIGSYEMFRDKIAGGLKHESHTQLALNIFSWLRTTKREQLKLQGTQNIPQSTSSSEISEDIESDVYSETPSSNYSFIQPKKFESTVKILAKEDLFKAFEDTLTEMIGFKDRVLKEFDILQTNMANLMRVIIAKEGDFINMNEEPPENGIMNGNISNSSINLSPPPTFSFPPKEPNYVAKDNESLNKPSDYSSSLDNEIDEIHSEEEEVTFKNGSLIKKPKEELVAELESLENKLNSIRNLSAFVEKKFASGKLEKSNFDKQMKKLDSDSKKTKFRIDEIKDLLLNFQD